MNWSYKEQEINLSSRLQGHTAVATLKLLSPGLTKLWFKVSLCKGILTGCEVAPTIQEPMSLEVKDMHNWRVVQ